VSTAEISRVVPLGYFWFCEVNWTKGRGRGHISRRIKKDILPFLVLNCAARVGLSESFDDLEK